MGQWIDDGLKIAGPVVGALDPPLAPVIAAVEAVLGGLQPGQVKIDADFIKEVVTAITLLESLKVLPVPPPTPTIRQG